MRRVASWWWYTAPWLIAKGRTERESGLNTPSPITEQERSTEKDQTDCERSINSPWKSRVRVRGRICERANLCQHLLSHVWIGDKCDVWSVPISGEDTQTVNWPPHVGWRKHSIKWVKEQLKHKKKAVINKTTKTKQRLWDARVYYRGGETFRLWSWLKLFYYSVKSGRVFKGGYRSLVSLNTFWSCWILSYSRLTNILAVSTSSYLSNQIYNIIVNHTFQLISDYDSQVHNLSVKPVWSIKSMQFNISAKYILTIYSETVFQTCFLRIFRRKYLAHFCNWSAVRSLFLKELSIAENWSESCLLICGPWASP